MADTTAPANVLDRVLRVIAEVLALERERIAPASAIREELGADSLDVVTLVWALEEEFGGKIDDAEIESLTTPERIAAYVAERMEGAHGT